MDEYLYDMVLVNNYVTSLYVEVNAYPRPKLCTGLPNLCYYKMSHVAVVFIWYLTYATTEVSLAILVKDTMWHDSSTMNYKDFCV